MRRTIAIFGIVVFLGVALFFLKPGPSEKAVEEKKTTVEELEPEKVATLNPLLPLAMQESGTKSLESVNKAQVELIKRIKKVVLRVQVSGKRGKDEIAGLGVSLLGEGIIVAACKDLSRARKIEVLLPEGQAVEAELVKKDAESGVSFLKLVKEVAVPMVELAESTQSGEWVALVVWDDGLEGEAVGVSTVAGKAEAHRIALSSHKNWGSALIFNAGRRLVGVRLGQEMSAVGVLAVGSENVRQTLKSLREEQEKPEEN